MDAVDQAPVPSVDPRRMLLDTWIREDRDVNTPLVPPDLAGRLEPRVSGLYRRLWYTYKGVSGLLDGLLSRGWAHTPRPWDMILALAATELAWSRFDKPYAAVSSWVDLGKERFGVKAAGMLNGTLRALCRAAEGRPVTPESLLPVRLLAAWAAAGGAPEGLAAVLDGRHHACWHPAGPDAPPPPGEPVAWEGGTCVRLAADTDPAAALAAHPGFFQDLGAARIARLAHLALPANATLLDFCAAPGGKAWQVSRLSAGLRPVILHEANPRRRRSLERSPLLARFPLARLAAPADLAPGAQAAVLADVPCSNSAVLTRSPEAVRHAWQSGDPFRSVQEGVLAQAAALLRPGGRLLYATCSIFPAENQERVRAFAQARGAMLASETLILPDAGSAHGGYLAALDLPA